MVVVVVVVVVLSAIISCCFCCGHWPRSSELLSWSTLTFTYNSLASWLVWLAVFDVRRSALNGLLARHWHHRYHHTQTAAKTIRQMSIALTLSLSSFLFDSVAVLFPSLSLSFTPCVQFVPNQMGRRFDRFLLFFSFSLPSHTLHSLAPLMLRRLSLPSIPSDPIRMHWQWQPLCRESLVVCVFSISLLLLLLFLLRATIFAGWHAIQVLLLQTCPPFSLPLSLSFVGEGSLSLSAAAVTTTTTTTSFYGRHLRWNCAVFADTAQQQHTANCSVFLPDWLCPLYTVSFTVLPSFLFGWKREAMPSLYRPSIGYLLAGSNNSSTAVICLMPFLFFLL